MNISEFKRLKKYIDKLIEQLEKEAIQNGVDITSPEFQDIALKFKQKILEQKGINLADYQTAEEELKKNKKSDISYLIEKLQVRDKQMLDSVVQPLKKEIQDWTQNEIKKTIEKVKGEIDYERILNRPYLLTNLDVRALIKKYGLKQEDIKGLKFSQLNHTDYDHYKIIEKIDKIFEQQKKSLKELEKLPRRHKDLSDITPDDHHPELHDLESHKESEWKKGLKRLLSGELVDDLHKHKMPAPYLIPAKGAQTFLELLDTPDSYRNQAGKVFKVKATEDGLEYGEAAANLDSLTDVVITSPVKNQALLFNGTNWVNAAQGTSFTFSIASFTWSGYVSTVEMGTGVWKVVGALSFTASYNNGPPDPTPYIDKTSPGWTNNLLMTGSGYTGPTTNTEAVNYPATINSSIVFTLYAQSGSETSSYSRTTTFKNKKYYGFHSQGTILDSAKTKTLANKVWVGSSGNDLDTPSTQLTPTGSQYIHFVYPSRLDPTTLVFKINGFDTDFTNLGTFTFTNDSGFSETYRDYVSPQAYDASVSFQVEATP